MRAGVNELAPVVRDVLEARLPEYDPWLYSYCGGLVNAEELETYVRHKSDLLDFAGIDPKGAKILDAGAGFGFSLVVIAALGAETARESSSTGRWCERRRRTFRCCHPTSGITSRLTKAT